MNIYLNRKGFHNKANSINQLFAIVHNRLPYDFNTSIINVPYYCFVLKRTCLGFSPIILYLNISFFQVIISSGNKKKSE